MKTRSFEARIGKEVMKLSREWSMPSPDTFDCPPIGRFVRRWLSRSVVSIDPFARNNDWATWTNDLNPSTAAQFHMDAEQFLREMRARGVVADMAIMDPPYSPRQISECYRQAGLSPTMTDTQNVALCKRVRDAVMPLLTNDAIVLSFGWNTVGMGQARGFSIEEILIVCHGGAHNDTICMAERLSQPRLALDFPNAKEAHP